MPEGEVSITPETYPAVFALMQAQLSGAVGQQTDTPLSNRVKSAQMVNTSHGILTVYELGDGVVRLLATAVSDNGIEPGEVNPAFAAIVTEDGIELTSVNEHGLAQFVGPAAEGPAGVARSPQAPLAPSIGPCENRGGTTCCFVVTDDSACVCCFSLVPGSTPVCNCMPIS